MNPLLLLLLALPAFSLSAPGQPIAETSFEDPGVRGRTPKAAGGDPTQAPAKPGQTPFWKSFEDHPDLGGECGAIIAGLTNEIARSGTQSLFVEATNLCAPYIGVQWASRPIPIEPKKSYRITLWGRQGSRRRPLPAQGTASPAPLYLDIEVTFQSGLRQPCETGENLYLVLPLQGPSKCGPGLNSEKWTPLGFDFEAPETAASFSVSFRCDGRAAKSAVNAVVFFDDFTVSKESPSAQEAAIACHPGPKPHRAIGINRPEKRFICLPLAKNQAKQVP